MNRRINLALAFIMSLVFVGCSQGAGPQVNGGDPNGPASTLSSTDLNIGASDNEFLNFSLPGTENSVSGQATFSCAWDVNSALNTNAARFMLLPGTQVALGKNFVATPSLIKCGMKYAQNVFAFPSERSDFNVSEMRAGQLVPRIEVVARNQNAGKIKDAGVSISCAGSLTDASLKADLNLISGSHIVIVRDDHKRFDPDTGYMLNRIPATIVSCD